VNKEEHPFEPYVPEGATKLIIGSFPPPRFASKKLYCNDVNYYYGSRNNHFWDILSEALDVKLVRTNMDDEIKQREKLLRENNLGICDIIKTAHRKDENSSSDSTFILDKKYYFDLKKLLLENKSIDTLLYTSNFVKNCVYKYVGKEHSSSKFNDKNNLGIEINGKLYKVNILPSPSFRNTIPISKKIEIYRQVLI
jgi:G:T/U-mismatch repair DNA glycosylase